MRPDHYFGRCLKDLLKHDSPLFFLNFLGYNLSIEPTCSIPPLVFGRIYLFYVSFDCMLGGEMKGSIFADIGEVGLLWVVRAHVLVGCPETKSAENVCFPFS